MKERVLRLSKRLSKFTLDEMLTITEDINESVLRLLLTTLVQEQKLIQRGDLYLYKKPNIKPKPRVFQMYEKQLIELTIRSFCANVTTKVASNIVGLTDDTIRLFYKCFREELYKRQYKALVNYHSNDPQRARHCKFFEQEIYLYVYNNNIFISEELFNNINNRLLKHNEVKEFKKNYSYISRILSHNKNSINLCSKIAESIWRRNKTFEELYSDLKSLLFS